MIDPDSHHTYACRCDRCRLDDDRIEAGAWLGLSPEQTTTLRPEVVRAIVHPDTTGMPVGVLDDLTDDDREEVARFWSFVTAIRRTEGGRWG